ATARNRPYVRGHNGTGPITGRLVPPLSTRGEPVGRAETEPPAIYTGVPVGIRLGRRAARRHPHPRGTPHPDPQPLDPPGQRGPLRPSPHPLGPLVRPPPPTPGFNPVGLTRAGARTEARKGARRFRWAPPLRPQPWDIIRPQPIINPMIPPNPLPQQNDSFLRLQQVFDQLPPVQHRHAIPRLRDPPRRQPRELLGLIPREPHQGLRAPLLNLPDQPALPRARQPDRQLAFLDLPFQTLQLPF